MDQTLYLMFFRAFSNRTRLDIINLLKRGPLTVTEIGEKLNFEQSRVSHNLKFLESYGFVVSWKYGKWTKYSVNKETILPIVEMCEAHIKKHRKEVAGKKSLQQILTTLNIALPEDHNCGCVSCIGLPELLITVSNLKDNHTCMCNACIANFKSILDPNSPTELREDHTCTCDACAANQEKLANLS